MAEPDYSTWHTKQQAADIIGVSTKTIEQLAKTSELTQATWKREKGMPIVVFHPGDVTRIAHARHPMRPYTPPPSPQDDQALTIPNAGVPDLARLAGFVLEAFRASLVHTKLFLTVNEAAIVSGLSRAFLRAAIKDGRLAAVRDRGWKIRRADVERL